jgi:tRNA threonylcarbamoyladenosine biosynthesis protein TsaB
VNVLAIESATLQGGVAVSRNSQPPIEHLFAKGMVHGRELASSIDLVCRRAGLEPAELDLLVCDIGPGSYTGLRVGLAYARTLAWALSKPIVGVVSLDALAERYRRGHSELADGLRIVPTLDAKWNQVYYAAYEIKGGTVHRVDGPRADPPEVFYTDASPRRVFGDALDSLLDRIRSTGADNLLGLEPLYLRPTEAELKRAAASA